VLDGTVGGGIGGCAACSLVGIHLSFLHNRRIREALSPPCLHADR
jgi:hypothetical protein